MALSKAQIGVIHVAKAKLGLDDEAYRDVLERLAGVRSSKDLDRAGFDVVMTEFERLGFVSDYKRAGFGSRRQWDMASFKQVNLIRDLWEEVTDGTGTEQGLNTFLDTRFKVGALRMVDRHKASKIIAGLKAWKKRNGERSSRAA